MSCTGLKRTIFQNLVNVNLDRGILFLTQALQITQWETLHWKSVRCLISHFSYLPPLAVSSFGWGDNSAPVEGSKRTGLLLCIHLHLPVRAQLSGHDGWCYTTSQGGGCCCWTILSSFVFAKIKSVLPFQKLFFFFFFLNETRSDSSTPLLWVTSNLGHGNESDRTEKIFRASSTQ